MSALTCGIIQFTTGNYDFIRLFVYVERRVAHACICYMIYQLHLTCLITQYLSKGCQAG